MHPAPTAESAATRSWISAPDGARVVTAAEWLSLTAATGIAVTALMSLAAAHLGVLTLGTVIVSTIVAVVVLAGLVFASGPRPRFAWDLPGLAVTVIAAAFACWLYFPGFHYAAGDRDPGGYVMHAIEMSRSHSYDFIDKVITDGLPYETVTPGARFPAIWIHDPATGQIVPQFYHLWPALLATSWNLRGWGGVTNTTPLVAVVAVMLVVVLARRVTMASGRAAGIASLGAAVVAGAVLAPNMLQVWQAKYPTAEILAQLLFTAATLALVISIQTRWRWPAGIAGLLVGIGLLERADAILLVFMLVGLGAALWVLRRFDARGWWGAVGLALLLPYGLWQAYGPAKSYTISATHLSLTKVVGVIGAVVLAALVLRPLGRPLAARINALVESRRAQVWLGLAVAAVVGALFGLAIIRPSFGQDFVPYNNGPIIRSYDEQNAYRLAWFLTWPGWLLMLAGVALVALRRWRASAWAIALPLLLLLPVYMWHSRNSPWLMWWGRRFVSSTLVGIAILVALATAWLAVSWLMMRRARAIGVIAGVAAVAGAAWMAGTGVSQSLPVRHHDEWGGSYDVERRISALAGDEQGVYLWSRARYCCAAPQALFGAPMWLIWDEISVVLPKDPADVPEYVEAYVEHFAEQPVFLVYDHGEEPPAMDGLEVTKVKQFVGTLPRWTETPDYRPTSAIDVPYDFTVYRVTQA
jgi:hypothetical protein